MPKAKRIDPNQWLTDTAKKLGLDPAQVTLAQLTAHGDFGREFGGSFVDVPTFQSELSQKDQELGKVTQFNTQWQQRYYNDLLGVGTPAAIAALEAAGFDTTELQPAASGGGVHDTRTGETYSKAEVQRMIQQELRTAQTTTNQQIEDLRKGMLGFTTFVTKEAPRYRNDYGKDLDVQAFTDFAAEHRAEYPTFGAALRAFESEDLTKKTAADQQKWRDEERKKLRAEVLTEYNLPEIPMGEQRHSPFHAKPDPKEQKSGEQPYSYSMPAGASVTVNTQPPPSTSSKERVADKYRGMDLDFSSLGSGSRSAVGPASR